MPASSLDKPTPMARASMRSRTAAMLMAACAVDTSWESGTSDARAVVTKAQSASNTRGDIVWIGWHDKVCLRLCGLSFRSKSSQTGALNQKTSGAWLPTAAYIQSTHHCTAITFASNAACLCAATACRAAGACAGTPCASSMHDAAAAPQAPAYGSGCPSSRHAIIAPRYALPQPVGSTTAASA